MSVVDLDVSRRRSEEVVRRLRAESLARLERARRRRTLRVSVLGALVSLTSLAGIQRYQEQTLQQVQQAEADAKERAARAEERAELERKLAAIQRAMEVRLCNAPSYEERARIRAEYETRKERARHR
jgi:hypothetical protein